MNRTTNWFAGALLALTPLAFAQEPQLTPQFPEDALASQQLVAWSRMQNPQPAPQPLPPRDTPIPQPDPQGQQAKLPSNPQNSQAPTQSFTGKIVQDGGKYVLKVSSNSTFQLEGEGDVQKYENQDVKVVGTLDTGTNVIRVVKIELIS
jgi:hypothetical protein